MWNIHCEVWGGVTGHRGSLLKFNDEIIRFDTKEAAEAEAMRLNEKVNNPNSKATFLYTAIKGGM